MDGSVVTIGHTGGSGSGDSQQAEFPREVEFYSLVSYLPEGLSKFLSELRRQFDPRFPGKPHLTILPPRPLKTAWSDAWSELRRAIVAMNPVTVELGDVETFPASRVVYLSLRQGYASIEALHETLNAGCASCGEVWPYHPHITLAHGIRAENFEEAAREGQLRWNEYGGERQFLVRRLTWVKTSIAPGLTEKETRGKVTSENAWTDLAESDLMGLR